MVSAMNEPEIISNLGHNHPPSVEALRDALLAEQDHALEARRQRRDQFIAAAQKAVIRNRQDIADAGDVIHLAGKVWDEIDVQARALRMPVRQLADSLKARVDAFWQPVDDSHLDLQRRMDAWLDEEKARIEAQRAEQDEILGDIAKPQPSDNSPRTPSLPAAPKSRPIRGDLGGQVTRRADTEITVTDVRAVPDFILNAPVVTDAIISVVRSMAKAGADIPGITVRPVDRTVIS